MEDFSDILSVLKTKLAESEKAGLKSYRQENNLKEKPEDICVG